MRMLSVARLLEARGDSVKFSSSGDAVTLIRKEGYACSSLPLVDVSWKDDGRFSALDTARSFPQSAGRFTRQIREEARNIASFGADSVLSDSMMATVIAARLAKTRVVTVLNQLRLESSRRTPPIAASLISAGTVSIGAALWNLSDAILFPDLPEPYTISERNLRPSEGGKSRYVGFLTPPKDQTRNPLAERLKGEKRLKVYWQVSGPSKTRAPLISAAFRIADTLKDKVLSIVSGGDPSGEVEARKMPFGWFYEWCPGKDSILETADLVVSRAGHTSIAQFILNEKPSLLVPIPQQTEQEGNAEKAERLGIAARVEQVDLSPRTFSEASERLLGGSFREKLREVSSVARRLDAKTEIVKALT